MLKQFCCVFIQTIYLLYVIDAKPHTNEIFNHLEIFNEGMIILMCYTMICFSGIGPFAEILKSATPIYFSVGITGLIVAANFGVMIKMTLGKIRDKWKTKRYKK